LVKEVLKPDPEIAADAKKYLPPSESIELAFTDGPILVKKLKKNGTILLKHPNASGDHAKFVPDGIVDTSSNGTFVIYRGSTGTS
jgi:hypothetical protein